MKINISAVEKIVSTLHGANNDVQRELIHALQYHQSVKSDHSAIRLMSAAAVAVNEAQSQLWDRGAVARSAFIQMIEVAA